MKNLRKYINQVIQGDCLEIMKDFPDNSIDMILCDLPYGTTQNKWDSIIPLEKLWKQYERIIKDNGAIVLTSQGLFTAKLILSNEKLFKYKIVWVKSKPTNFLNARKQPLRKHEDICIFYKKQPVYNPQMTIGEPYNKGVRKNQYSGSYGNFKPIQVKSNGERFPTDVLIDELGSSIYDYPKLNGHTNLIDTENFNDVIYCKTAESEGKVLHPTQKPVSLGQWLINTFTNKGDIVLDNTCGSGSFLVAALLEERQFIGIEKNEDVLLHKKQAIDYIEVCKKRLEQAQKTVESSFSVYQ